jgi:hypothetical protein
MAFVNIPTCPAASRVNEDEVCIGTSEEEEVKCGERPPAVCLVGVFPDV